MRNLYFKKSGFTLTETVVVIFIFTLLAVGTTNLFTHIFINSQNRLLSLDSIDQAKIATTNFSNEVRTASVGADGSAPINQAGDYQITFYSDYGQSSGAVAKIHYYLATTTSSIKLYKAVTVPSGSPLAYNPSNEKISLVQSNISTGTPVFYYYDGNYSGSSTPLTQPVNINDIKFVRINLSILKQTERNSTSTFTASAGATIRSLKDNLGN